MNPFFSVIMPTYNRQAVISKAIDSVVQQSFTEWELIIVDDGSTDNTYEFLTAKYLDPRIKVFTKTHAERSSARNYGIEKSVGKYICFLDSDDEYLPGFLSSHYEAIVANPTYKIFRVGTYLVKEGTKTPLPFPDPTWSALEAICREFNGFPSYCFERDLLQSFRFDERFNIGEDFHFVMRVVCEVDRIFFIKSYEFLINYNPKSEILYFGKTQEMITKANAFEDLLTKYKFPSKIKELLIIRILVVQMIIIKTIARNFSFEHLKASIKAITHFVQYPLITIKAIRSLRK